jgi:hypothetical protein
VNRTAYAPVFLDYLMLQDELRAANLCVLEGVVVVWPSNEYFKVPEPIEGRASMER